MIWDTIVVGAGAAGLMTAITAARQGVKNVLLLDAKEKIGAKILMSGGTRCNLTNAKITEKDFETEEKNILRSVLQSFSSAQALEFFEEIGVEVVLEDGGKFFPVTHSGRTVLEALQKEIARLSIKIHAPRKVSGVSFQGNEFLVSGAGFDYRARTIALTTGGLSYPATGSDGSGYTIAKSFGHRLIPTTSALTPLLSEDKEWRTLSGLALPAKLSVWFEGKKQRSAEGDFLFTHFGFSGPVVLDISRHWARNCDKKDLKISVSFLPSEEEQKFREKILGRITEKPNQSLKSFMEEFLPVRFVNVFFKKNLISDIVLNQLSKDNREKLCRSLFYCPLEVKGVFGYEKAEVTAGGIDLAEVHRLTLESKSRSGLFFAGEVLDVDGRIGGFNFQWAWSSGFVAGSAIAKKVLHPE